MKVLVLEVRKITSLLSTFGIVFLFFALAQLPLANASSGPISCSAVLSGANEVPPNPSPATGSGTFTFDPLTSTTTWSVTWSGLTVAATAAHIHSPASPSTNAPVRVPITGIAGLTSGSSSGSTTSLIGITPAQFAIDLLAGMAYMNIHTSNFPGGEIRGQLSCTEAHGVPEFNLPPFAVAALLLPVILVLSLRGRNLKR